MAASANAFKRKIGREIYFLFEKYPEPLYFGSVSPDIFYYDIRMPWEFRIKNRGLIWGELIHGTHGENSLAHVLAMLEILNDAKAQAPLSPNRTLTREERGALLLFALGYLSHVALDTILHPIVYYYSGNYYAEDRAEKLRAEARHRAVETVFDLYNLDSVGQDLRQFRGLKKISLPRQFRDPILGFYTLSLLRAWPNLARDEFGAAGAIPANIYKHPLFKIALRSYKNRFSLTASSRTRGWRTGVWVTTAAKTTHCIRTAVCFIPRALTPNTRTVTAGSYFRLPTYAITGIRSITGK